MKPGDRGDDLIQALKGLPVEDHSPTRARLIRDRAVALLARRRRRATRLERLVSSYSRFVEPALAGALSVGFALWTVARSLEILRTAREGFFWP